MAAELERFRPSEVRLLPSRFRDNMERDSVWISSIPVGSLLHSFRNTSGVFSEREGGYMTMPKLGGWESLDCDLRGHTTGHLLSAMAYLGMREKADSLISGLAEVQKQYGTGYLSAFGEGLIDRNIAGKSVWAPFYTLHKILSGLMDQYELCGNTEALELAKGMGDWAYAKLSPLSDEVRRRMIRNEFGGFNEAMYRLFAATKEDRYLRVARFFYHDERIDPLKKGDDNLGTAHANTFIPKLLGECLNYELFGAEDSRSAAELLFSTLSSEHSFVTGEVSDKEHLFPPEEQYLHLSGYNGESCCTYNLLKLAERLFCYEPRSSIAEYYERALYNHILGQQDPQTSMVCYFTPLQSGAYRLYSQPDKSFWCCVGSGFESHSRYNSAIYYHGGDSLYVNLFIPSELDWNGMIVCQETDFPESGRIDLTLSGDVRKATLMLRYPSWATEMKIDGRRVNNKYCGGYVALSRNWKKGQRITIDFGMELHEEALRGDNSRKALLYGPVVLAGELAEVSHPFSDPSKYNDYYNFDYGVPQDRSYYSISDFKRVGPLKYEGPGGITVKPFYDLHHHRYVVYWKQGAHDTASNVQLSSAGTQELSGRPEFDYSTGEEGERAYIRLPRGTAEVKALLYCHQNMTEEVLFRSRAFLAHMDRLGVAMVFVQRGSQNWDVSEGCQERFEAIVEDLAGGTHHPEILSAPVIPFGHSAQATFPWNFAAWNPERTLCIISYHGDAPRTNLCGYGRANVEWGRTRNIDRIPGLMIEGEYEWWEARVRPALAFRMMYPDSRISFLCDAGKGHFDLCPETQEYIALFIEKALSDPRPEGGVYYSRWSADGVESDNPYDMFWYQDEEMVSLTRARYAQTRGKKEQYVSAKLNGTLLTYDPAKHIKINAVVSGDGFTLEPVFTDADRAAESIFHAPVRCKVTLISGPAIQTGEYSFVVDEDYFGRDPMRLWSGITLCVEADGDDTYKPAVQEINIQLR